ncbi:MAG: heme ABC transporter permease CcmC [Zymomonas mobilis]|uniref:Heme exporter protein C n=1 Tax=Zymomonas mobilis TaxID=542 RepID=A0A542W217_ZYMMB|nr:heme ABC transporter permease CcmC [Zymomonas mobilis]TQL17626.1 heme exporter protein C [Zymomonas mobilis]
MIRLANPHYFLSLSRKLTPWLAIAGILFSLSGILGGLFLTPPDYLQGETVRILYIHVPTAWLAMGGWSSIALASLVQFIWRHPLAGIAAKAMALPGALFTGLCLLTGSIWGRPTWGTWWEWDGRLTSVLVLFFLYLGYIALSRSVSNYSTTSRLPALYALLGAINLPIIHYSVLWWRTLHQGQSINLTHSSIDPSLLWPLPLTLIGFSCLFAVITLFRMRYLLAHAQYEARLRRMAAL